MLYPIDFTPDTNGTILVSFPDLPWVHTFGDDKADALVHAQEALETALEFLIRERRPIPAPSRRQGAGVAVPALVAAKVEIHNLMMREGVTRAELSRRLNVHRPQVDRLLDPKHATRFDEVERVFHLFGRRLELAVRPEIAGGAAHGVAPRRARKAMKR